MALVPAGCKKKTTMVIIDQTIDREIGEKLKVKNEIERTNHILSGKFSASMLGNPIQWNILKMVGVPAKEIDEYTLRKFKRGKDIEEWLISHMKSVVDSQKPVSYRGWIGFIDALVDTKDYEFQFGIIPHEIKSVTNMAFKYITKEAEAKMGHKLQGGFYALGEKSTHFAIDYVASDDLRVHSFVYPTEEIKPEIDKRIDENEGALHSGTVPGFEPREGWQKMVEYNNYPDWVNLTPEQIEEKLRTEYPESYNKLKELEAK